MRAAFITVLGAALIALGASGPAWSEHDDDDRGGRASAQGSRTRGDLAPRDQ